MIPDSGSETLEGVLERFVWANEDESFCVAVVRPEDGEPVRAVGALGGLRLGEVVRLQGSTTLHPKFGEQFKAETAHPVLPHTSDGIERYLVAAEIPGIGRGMAKRLVTHFGEETLHVIDHEPDRLTEVEGIGVERSRELRGAFLDQRSQRDAMVFLQGHGLPAGLAARIFHRHGDDTVTRVRDNPYRLAEEVRGVGFLTADRIARTLGFAEDDPLRAAAGLLHLLGIALDDGHVFLPREPLIERARSLLGAEAPAEVALGALVAEGRVVDDEGLYLHEIHALEVEAAERVAVLLTAPVPALPSDLRAFEAATGMDLAEAQRDAVTLAGEAPIFALTGGPGTGKTTIVRALLYRLGASDGRVLLAAPTGRAARRMSEATGHEASTLHRLLEYSPIDDTFRRDEQTPLEAAAVVVDEASMVDLRLLVALLRALEPGTRLVLVGDADQLPSVGAGNVLGDLLASGVVPTTRLTEIFRQARHSRIVTGAHAVLAGHEPQAPERGSESDFFIVEVQGDAAKASDLIEQLVAERIPQAFGHDPVDDVQVLAPMHRGACGAQRLNERLQARLNPDGALFERGYRRFRIGDKVMQIKNDYEREVFNGDIGRVDAIAEGGLVVRFDGRQVAVPPKALDRLVLAYACTVHKSQGSEYPAVVVPMVTEHWVMLQRNLLYTALTRGKELVVLVAQQRALRRAVRNDDGLRRYTALARRLSA